MADCSASGTAIDRVIQSAVASTLNQGSNGAVGGNAISSAATSATRAIGNFLGGTAATSSSMGGVVNGGGGVARGGSQSLMPLAPMESIGGGINQSSGANAIMINSHQPLPQSTNYMMNNQMDSAWAVSTSSSSNNIHQSIPQHMSSPMNNHMIQHSHPHHMHHQAQLMHQPPPQMIMQQQQQQQMMMIQQIQMQQHQMAAMVQHQKNQQQQQMQLRVVEEYFNVTICDTIR